MKKRILLITNGFPFGESERSFLGTEVEELTQRFHLIILAVENDASLIYPIGNIEHVERFKYTPLHSAGISEILSNAISPIALKEFRIRIKNCGIGMSVDGYRETLFFFHRAREIAKKITKLMEETPIDLIYTYWCLPYTLGALLVKQKYPQIKVVTRFHGYDLYNEREETGWQPFRHVIAEECDRLVFACEMGRNYFLSHWGQEWAKKSLVSYLGCAPLSQIPIYKSERLSLVSCSNAIPLKRIHLIIESLALLPEQIQVEWHHIGDGPELENLKKLASEKLSTLGNISWKFWGYVPNHQLDLTYKLIQPQLFITTSETEGLPVSIQEAFSAGVPAIGTAVGGVPELIQTGENGYLLLENPKPAEIAKAITAFCFSSEDQRRAMSNSANTSWRKNFNAKKNAICFSKSLEEILK